MPLFGGRAHQARVYPPKFVASIFRGARNQMLRECETHWANVQEEYPVPEDPLIPDIDPKETEVYVDEVNGAKLVREARK